MVKDGDWDDDWIEDCEAFRGELLTGKYSHWCLAYDDLPVDETCHEWPCGCYPGAGSVQVIE